MSKSTSRNLGRLVVVAIPIAIIAYEWVTNLVPNKSALEILLVLFLLLWISILMLISYELGFELLWDYFWQRSFRKSLHSLDLEKVLQTKNQQELYTIFTGIGLQSIWQSIKLDKAKRRQESKQAHKERMIKTIITTVDRIEKTKEKLNNMQ